MYDHLHPGDVFKCDCGAVYEVTARDTIEDRDDARCICCNVILTDWPKEYGFDLKKASDQGIA